MNLKDYSIGEKTYLFTPEDCLPDMLKSLREGKVKGTTTYNEELDKCWTWRQQEANIWTGYSNEGKSLFLKQLALIKALKDDKKFVFCSPEDFPPDEFYDDLIHTLVGKTTDKNNLNQKVVSEEFYMAAYEMIKKHFFFLYIEPPDNTIKGVLERFKEICAKHEIFGCVIDPILKFARPKLMSDRDDIYASYIGSICVDFCRQTNTSFHLVMHQLTPQKEIGASRYPEPSMYKVKGGGSWADGFDNILSVWRPDYYADKLSTNVQFASQKIKKQKLVGIPQKIALNFDRKTNRYMMPMDETTGYAKDLFDFDTIMKECEFVV